MKLEELDITGWGVEGWAFGIDPETYIQKAQKYWEQQEYEKSQEYFHKAREWYAEKGDLHKVALCEKFIENLPRCQQLQWDKPHRIFMVPILIS